MRAQIHVNMHTIRRNHKTGEREPVITWKTYKKNTYHYSIILEGKHGPIEVKYSPDKPLSCGARVWIETDTDNIRNIDV